MIILVQKNLLHLLIKAGNDGWFAGMLNDGDTLAPKQQQQQRPQLFPEAATAAESPSTTPSSSSGTSSSPSHGRGGGRGTAPLPPPMRRSWSVRMSERGSLEGVPAPSPSSRVAELLERILAMPLLPPEKPAISGRRYDRYDRFSYQAGYMTDMTDFHIRHEI